MKNIKNMIIFEDIKVENILKEMGLDKDGLLNAALSAAGEKALCTENDPVGFPNYLVYAKTARRIREIYCIGKSGWVKDDTSNQAAIKHIDKKIRVVPCNFNEFAGDQFAAPTNKSPKGEISKKKSFCNRTSWLPGVPDIVVQDDDGYQTWILGIHTNENGLAGLELSLPIDFDGSYFTAFAQRIIIFSGSESPVLKQQKDKTVNDDSVKIVDIAVSRKK